MILSSARRKYLILFIILAPFIILIPLLLLNQTAFSSTNINGNATAGGALDPSTGLGLADRDEALGAAPWQDGETVVKAYRQAYPERVREVSFRNEDWAMRLDDEWFYWAGGKLLPEEALLEVASYSRYAFYPYSLALPPLREFSKEEIVALEGRVNQRSSSGIGRHPGIMDALWGVHDQRSSDQKVKTLYLFGQAVNVHQELLEDLSRIEDRIIALAKTDGELAVYLDSLAQIAGYSWRNIASSSNRSLHAYGIALDFLPRSYNQEQVYWLWARESGLSWYNLPYDQRFMPPQTFISAFEQEGFIWGGKWLYFDTIHFEYRPEILVINGIHREN